MATENLSQRPRLRNPEPRRQPVPELQRRVRRANPVRTLDSNPNKFSNPTTGVFDMNASISRRAALVVAANACALAALPARAQSDRALGVILPIGAGGITGASALAMGVVALPAVQAHLKSGALRAIGLCGKKPAARQRRIFRPLPGRSRASTRARPRRQRNICAVR